MRGLANRLRMCRLPLAPIMLLIELHHRKRERELAELGAPSIRVIRDESLRRENLPNEGLPEL